MMRSMRWMLCLSLLCLIPGAAWGQSDAPVRLGYVDLERAVQATQDGQRAMEQLQRELADRQEALDRTEQELQQLTETLEQEIVMLDADQRRERLQEYQGRVASYQEQFTNNQRELYELEAEATREIVGRMLEIVAEIAREQELTMVFEKTRSSLVWAADGLDLTDELIRRYEAGGSGGSDDDDDDDSRDRDRDDDDDDSRDRDDDDE